MSILREAAIAYFHSMQRYQQHFGTDKADDAQAEMQTIERCLQVREVSTEWRGHPSLAGRK